MNSKSPLSSYSPLKLGFKYTSPTSHSRPDPEAPEWHKAPKAGSQETLGLTGPAGRAPRGADQSLSQPSNPEEVCVCVCVHALEFYEIPYYLKLLARGLRLTNLVT